MTKNEERKLEASIIAKIRTKKKQSNIDQFLLLVATVGEKTSPDMLNVYRTLMKDLIKI